MPKDPIQHLDYAPHESPRRSWLNRISTLLCIVCFLMLGIGIAIEAATRNLLFENYISTFTGYGIILAVVASLSRPSRHAG
jgi:hypothetical protein